MNINLTPELESYIQSQIESGTYSNVGEVIQEALRLKIQQDEILRPKIVALREAIVAGENSGVSALFDIQEIIHEARTEVGM